MHTGEGICQALQPLEREPADDDRRRLHLRPTQRGKELAVAAGERKRAFREWVASQLSSSEIAVGREFWQHTWWERTLQRRLPCGDEKGGLLNVLNLAFAQRESI